eukprot:Pgem_evm1s3043
MINIIILLAVSVFSRTVFAKIADDVNEWVTEPNAACLVNMNVGVSGRDYVQKTLNTKKACQE